MHLGFIKYMGIKCRKSNEVKIESLEKHQIEDTKEGKVQGTHGQIINSKMIDLNPTILRVTLNANDLHPN